MPNKSVDMRERVQQLAGSGGRSALIHVTACVPRSQKLDLVGNLPLPMTSKANLFRR